MRQDLIKRFLFKHKFTDLWTDTYIGAYVLSGEPLKKRFKN